MIETIWSILRPILATRATQLIVRALAFAFASWAGYDTAKANDAAAGLAQGIVTLLLAILDYVSHHIQKRDAQ